MERYAQQLRQDIWNDKNIVLSSKMALVIKDKYPKSQHHYIVTPKNENIKNVLELSAKHLDLIKNMFELSLKLIDLIKMSSKNFLFGFSRDSSAQILVMHVISKDFCSDHLKYPRDWTKFHTIIFLPYPVAYSLLQMQGKIEPLSADDLINSRTATLACNHCGLSAGTMTFIKDHLMKHMVDWQRDQDSRFKLPKIITKNKTQISCDNTDDLDQMFKSLSINSFLKKSEDILSLSINAENTEKQPKQEKQQEEKFKLQQIDSNVKQETFPLIQKKVEQIKTIEPIISHDVNKKSGPAKEPSSNLKYENDSTVPDEEQLKELPNKEFCDYESCNCIVETTANFKFSSGNSFELLVLN